MYSPDRVCQSIRGYPVFIEVFRTDTYLKLGLVSALGQSLIMIMDTEIITDHGGRLELGL